MDMIAQKALIEALRYGYISLRLAAARHAGRETSDAFATLTIHRRNEASHDSSTGIERTLVSRAHRS